jgi:TonB family protein
MKSSHIRGAACLCVALASLMPHGLCGQSIGAQSPVGDANQLLQQAIRANGLAAEGQRPWHIRVSFDLAASFLQDADTGTIEEWWISDTHYKRSIAGKNFVQTEYGTESGVRRVGVRDGAPPIYSTILNGVLHPIDIPEDAVASLSVNRAERNVGDLHFSCLATEAGKSTPSTVKVTPWIYCLDSDHPVLRMGSSPNGSGRVFLNHIVLFDGRYIAKQVEYTLDVPGGHNPQRIWSVQVEQLEGLKDEDAKGIDPPPGALAAPATVTLSEKEARILLLDHPKPVYPPIAQAARVWGDVVCKIKVGVDGHVNKMGVVSGNPMLQGAALEALKRWTFKPAQLNGDAAEIETTITVPFRLQP